MGKRAWGYTLKRMVCQFFVAALAGLALDHWLGDGSNGPLLTALIGVIVYLALAFALTLLNAAGDALCLLLFGKNDLQAIVLDDMRRMRVPGPLDYQARRFDYLSELADDDSLEPVARVRAAALASAYGIIIKRAGFFAGMAWSEAADRATKEYAEEVPKNICP